MWSYVHKTVGNFLKNEEGPTSSEYALLLGVMGVILLTVIFSLCFSAPAQEPTKNLRT